MKMRRSFSGILWLVLFVIIFAAGCEQQQAKDVISEPVALSLKFRQGETSKYRVVMEMEKSLDFGGEISQDSQFVGGKTGDRAEVVFTEQIEAVDGQGNGTAKITITELKYFSREKDAVHVDFDSTRAADKESPLYSLTGASYTVDISSKSEVFDIKGTGEITSQFTNNTLSKRIADMLVSQEMIEKRHSLPMLTTVGGRTFSRGDQWRYPKQVSYGQMGSELYDVVYTFSGIERKGGRQIAVINISSVPALKTDEQSNALMQMFDNTSSLTGECKLDLTEGKLVQYSEKVGAQWLMVDPEASAEQGQEPSTIKMGYMQSHSIERID